MKKTILYLFVICLFQLKLTIGLSQNFKSIFGENTTSWKLTFCNLDIGGSDSLYANGDTIIKNKTYKKVYALGTNYKNIFYGGIREDTVLGQAWWKTLNKNFVHDTSEILILNMQLAVGDSFNFNLTTSYQGNNKWVKVSNLYFKSGLKYIVFNKLDYFNNGILYNDTLTFIEGVGPNYSIMYLMYGNINLCPYVICSYRDGSQYYSTINNKFKECRLIDTKIENINYKQNEALKIIPNPADESTIISFQSSVNHDIVVNIYDITGRKVKTEKLKGKASTGNQTVKLNTNDLKDGIYFIRLMGKDFSSTEKVVVSH